MTRILYTTATLTAALITWITFWYAAGITVPAAILLLAGIPFIR